MGAGYPVSVQETRMKGEPGKGLRLHPYCAPMPQWGCGFWGDLRGGGTPGQAGALHVIGEASRQMRRGQRPRGRTDRPPRGV